jgi:four helix bundle protein
MLIFQESKSFPKEETYSLTDQIRRSSRSVCANLAEAWRKRRYKAAFIAKLSDAESEAAETQVWLEFATKCPYLKHDHTSRLYQAYDEILRMLVAAVLGNLAMSFSFCLRVSLTPCLLFSLSSCLPVCLPVSKSPCLYGEDRR